MAKKREELQDEGIRLQVFLAQCGLGSRRGCEKIIAQGRVQVNGTLIKKQGIKIFPGDTVKLNGRVLNREKELLYIALNKPPRFLCSQSDPEGRPLAISLIQPFINYRLFHVGRLDFMSSGLIFYTNDGNFSRQISYPGNKVEKEYHVSSRKDIPQQLLDDFLKGITIEGETLRIQEYKRLGPQKVSLILTEGKNREIRRVFERHKVPIKKLHRVRIGQVTLGRLEPGHHRKLKTHEVESFFSEGTKKL